ncbi:haloacid dehalogenase superfamily enzyme, subfamily IA [Desulfosporosinus acidiphilus SJ4]|uniref:Haloacid dehalogenase superfamily enzyme, subfamily IA n=1 Tax=Desulfosporosinus acidiphilus (strain DSM 22704 / JCM 16185 / SJ4) TaxID=646529 RepID=I4D4P7_DESAJ|nr:HAD family hydrolase [Desulfosporosinus acidiphilus]AFM40771.1 haloacid dehalogenase superfamily enzyme, subfamily IA [Desulfosporosinus acidiphilus SJ4]
MKYKAAIFDLDGTLVDSLEDLAESMNAVLRRLNYEIHDLESYKYFIGNGIKNLVRQALPEESRDESIISGCFDSMLKEYRERCLDKTKPYAEVPELLDELTKRNIKLCILTNKADELAQKVVSVLLADWNFEFVIGPSVNIPRKPDPTGALLISSSLAIPPAEIIYLGDSGVDMQTAAAANMYAVGALWGYRTREELIRNGARSLIDHPLEFLKYL